MEIYIWAAAFVILVAIEMVTFQLVTVWFAVGSIAALIAAVFNLSLELQLVFFLVVSLILLIMVRPLTSRYLNNHKTKTNVDSLIGESALVTSRIHNQDGFGKATVKGQEWSAAAADDTSVIEPGTKVVITAISGVKLIVKKEQN